MQKPIMPKATALWLMNNTRLTWEQIGEFCGIHPLALEEMSVKGGIHPQNPILLGQLTEEEIARCSQNPTARLKLKQNPVPDVRKKKNYTPLSKRQEIPGAILWLIKNCPGITDNKIVSMLPTTTAMIKKIREGTHWNSKALVMKDPVLLGMCSQEDIDRLLS